MFLNTFNGNTYHLDLNEMTVNDRLRGVRYKERLES